MRLNIVLVVLISFLVVGCTKNRADSPEIVIPESALTIDNSLWGITLFDSLRIREDQTIDARTVAYLRSGVIFKIISRDNNISEFENMKNYWYNINYMGQKGWIFGGYIQVFNSLTEAERVCREKFYQQQSGE